LYENTELNVKKTLEATWEYWSRAYNCKFLISAIAGLNGKLVVDVSNVENANAYIFLQPNSFSNEISDTHGILENNMIYALTKEKQRTSGSFEVPADWTIGIAYNVGNFAGGVSMTTWV